MKLISKLSMTYKCSQIVFLKLTSVWSKNLSLEKALPNLLKMQKFTLNIKKALFFCLSFKESYGPGPGSSDGRVFAYKSSYPSLIQPADEFNFVR